jgi:N-acetylglucosaminyl-diphospho-decaprenol L-rhamnosyltransferase
MLGPAVDAIVVTFNSGEALRKQLACQAVKAAFSRIIVVDNASGDSSREVALAGGAELIERRHNGGLGNAANVGVRESHSDWFAMLNPDVLFNDESLVARLIGQVQDANVGLVAPLLVLPNGEYQDSARAIPSPFQLVARAFTRVPYGAVQPQMTADVPWVVAAFILVRRAAFDAVGGFDERFFLYFEDVDLCVRLWQAGWRVRLDTTVKAQHAFTAASRQSLLGPAARHHARSATRFFATHPRMLTRSGRIGLTRSRCLP